MNVPREILSLSPEEAARRIALSFLDEARAAAFRLDDEEDAEALHDFRVAVRRLRSTLRAWRPQLGKSAPGRFRKALRKIQNATGAGRDSEVALEWLAGERAQLRPAQRIGHDWLVERLEERRQRAMAHARRDVRRDFERVREPLQERLEVLTLEVHLTHHEPGKSFGSALAAQARQSAQELARVVAQVESAEDQRMAHRSRIACKRLRYLIEPVRSHVEGAPGVVKRCKQLQDVLGDLHDAYVLRDELGTSLEAAEAEHARALHELTWSQDEAGLRRATRRSPRAGLLALTRRVQQRIGELFQRFQEEWVEGGAYELVEEVERMAARLEQRAPLGVEIERKYLLRALPEIGGRADVLEVDQGWLPGERLHERVRRVSGEAGTRYFRTVKLGQGVRRTEIEEPTTREVYDLLWPLTEGCRIRKRRHRVREGDLVWEIDEFLDRPLVVAEVELADAKERPKIPDWLAPLVVREVTEDPRYTNWSLAQSEGVPAD